MESVPSKTEITINKKVTSINDEIAGRIKAQLENHRILSINIMGAPGSGKTSLIEGLALCLGPDKIAVIQGDLESDIDKQRLEKQGLAAYQINTHSGCHLNAKMIEQALKFVPLNGRQYLFIENVGNLVCPAGKQIGQDVDVVVSSVTEGSDKPRKYPIIFLNSRLVVIAKSDLAEAVDFDKDQYLNDLKNLNPALAIFSTSAKDPPSFKPVAGECSRLWQEKFGR